MLCWYIFYIELVEFCDAINIKGVKLLFIVILETSKFSFELIMLKN